MKRRLGKIAAAFLVLVLATGAATRAQAQTFTVLYSFTGPPDGAIPFAAMIYKAGNLYGTTNIGGAFPSPGGSVFKLDTSGNETVLYSFMGGSDGARPQSPLIMDTAGNLYGTTTQGGVAYPALGTLFKLDTSGKVTVLHNFTCSDGASGSAGLVMDLAGNLYGTTPGNSGNGCGFGTVFKLDTSGNYTVLHSYSIVDGGAPTAGLIMDPTGNLLYGTTSGDGVGFGTVFRLDTSGNNYTVLHSFTGGLDGGRPGAPLIIDLAGNLYGTTNTGGASSPGFGGTVFKLDTLGNVTTLYNYPGLSTPSALIMDKPGNLYGVTEFGGSFSCSPTNSFGCGTVFKLDTSGNYTVLHSFTGGSDGNYPLGGLVMDTGGNLYGTASAGGIVSSNCPISCGTVFKLTVQTPPPTITSISPVSAIAGGAGFTLTVNGTNFVSGSTVNFNGSALTTTFVGATQITAAILASDISSAGSFNVTVTNPAPGGGTSNAVSFAVNNPRPTITSLSPSSALVGGTAFTLTVNGTGFVPTSVVNFGTNARVTTFVSATQLTAAILASDIATAGGFNVTVTNPAPGGGTSNAVSVTVLTLQQATQAIINAVNALFAQGVLNGGQHNSLVRHLQHAIDLMNAGKNAGAIGNLDAFIGEVNDLLSSGVLSPSQAAPLVSAAESVIARLS